MTAHRVVIRPPLGKLALGALGALGFVVVGAVMVVTSASLLDKAVGLIAILFFGGGGLYFAIVWLRGGGRLALSPSGIEMPLGAGQPRLVPWDDVEAIGVTAAPGSKLVSVRLRRYDRFLAGMSPEEAKHLMRMVGRLRLAALSTVAVTAETLESANEVADSVSGLGQVSTVASLLAWQRAKYGAELFITWNMRDRAAEAFAAYLEEWRRRHATGS